MVGDGGDIGTVVSLYEVNSWPNTNDNSDGNEGKTMADDSVTQSRCLEHAYESI